MKSFIPSHSVSNSLLIINSVVACIYFSWWLLPGHVGNPWLYGLLVAGEIYHLLMAFSFWSTVWPSPEKKRPPAVTADFPSVDIFIPVVSEPLDVIKATAQAALAIDYPNLRVYILNDGRVAGKSNWDKVASMAEAIGAECITRTQPGGAKAGNINHALSQTQGEFIAIFDADMIPYPEFLHKTMGYFSDLRVAFVQSPQYYKNYQENSITSGAWDQQKLFFGPILIGKEKENAVFICGTNVVIRRKALEAVGGMVEDNIAEDFLTSLKIHQLGWRSHYVSEVLAEGLAPQDLGSYYKQQFRWTRGSLEVLFQHNPIFSRKLTWLQKMQYLSSALYYINGLIVLIDMAMPILYLLTGLQPVAATTTSFAIFFLPFMFLNLYTLYLASGKDVSFNTFSYTYSLWFLQIQALLSLVLGIKSSFKVTPKKAQQGSYLYLAIPHLMYIVLVIISSVIAIHRESITPSVTTNMAWALFSITLFIPYILLALNILPVKRIQFISAAEPQL